MHYQSMAMGEIIFVHLMFFIVFIYGTIPIILFYDILIGRAIDSIRKREPRRVYSPDYNKIGWMRFMLLWLLFCTGLPYFWYFSRRRKILVITVALCSSCVILLYWGGNSETP